MTWILAFHQWLYQATDGRLGHRLLGVPTLLLTTTGRRTGQPRTSALVYAESQGDFGVVASSGGSDRHPAWYLNLADNPTVTVQRKRETTTLVARTAEGEERAEWWKRCNDVNGQRFVGYQNKTDRRIPVVVLSPAAGPEGEGEVQ